jgi:hypothetical protein
VLDLDPSRDRSRHPELCEYIEQAVQGLAELMRQGIAQSFVILILESSTGQTQRSGGVDFHTPVVRERFVLELSNTAAPTVAPAGGAGASASTYDLEALEAQLRGFLLKVHVCNSMLAPCKSEGVSFSVEVHARPSEADAPLLESMRERWIECDAYSEVGSLHGPSRIVPLKSMCTPKLGVQLLVHEAKSRR